MKKETVMGIIGKTQGVNKAINPLPNAIQNNAHRLFDPSGLDGLMIAGCGVEAGLVVSFFTTVCKTAVSLFGATGGCMENEKSSLQGAHS